MSDSTPNTQHQPSSSGNEPVTPATGGGGASAEEDGDVQGSYLDKYVNDSDDDGDKNKKKKGAFTDEDESESEHENVKNVKNGDNVDGSEEEEVPNPYAHYDEDDEDDNKKKKKKGTDDDDDEEGGEEDEEDDENKVEDGEEGDDKKKDGKKDATPVVMPPGTGKPIAGARRVEMEVQEHEKQQYTFDSPDPQFFLGAAIVIGLVCLLTFFYRFLVDYGKVEDQLIPIVVFVGAFVVWIAPFVYYLFSSQHYAVWGKIGDGFAGSIPFFPLAAGIIFIYFILGRALYFVIVDGTLKDKYLVYPSCIVYALAFFPVFFFMMKLQANNANEYRIRHGIPPIDMSRPRFQTSGFMYMGIMFRRIIVAYVVGVCLAAHMALPFYALGWSAYGLYKLDSNPGWWVIILILVPIVTLIVALAIIPQTRFIPYILLRIVIMYFWYPIMQWDPRDGTSWVRYDNSLTFERMCNLHNRKIEAAERFHIDGEPDQMAAYYDAAKQDRATMESYGVNLKEYDP